jgi:flagellar basal-body rod modification protein FlgD
METSPAAGVVGSQAQQNPYGDSLNDVDMDVFLKLLIAELQNQDPLNPMDNNELLQQVSQIREIESNTRLTETLESVLLGQNMSTASGMIGRTVTALTDDAEWITGRVDRVSIADGKPRLIVGQHTVDLANVSEILAESGGGADDPGAGESS